MMTVSLSICSTEAQLAWLSDDSVYSYSGEHLGWYVDGWVIDHTGCHVFFTDNSKGGPLRPIRQVLPIRGIRGVRPVRGVRQIKPLRPIRTLSWSELSSEEFFN
jgi:hypothetical protein